MQLGFLSEAVKKKDLESLELDLGELDEWLAEVIATTRQLSIDLSPPVLKGEGVVEAVIWLAAQMKEQYSLNVAVNTNGVNAPFEEDVRVLVFQAVRELLFNVVKHSGVLQAEVDFEYEADAVQITVSDEGKGFDAEALMNDGNTGHGMRRLRDRLFLLGCRLIVNSEPDKGSQITIEAPIKGTMH